jgi:hypothetical protein
MLCILKIDTSILKGLAAFSLQVEGSISFLFYLLIYFNFHILLNRTCNAKIQVFLEVLPYGMGNNY